MKVTLPDDPGRSNLRKGARLAIVMPAVVVLGRVVFDSAEFSTFAAFAAFALLGLTNFSGPLQRRFLLGLGFSAVGAVIVLGGSLLEDRLVWSVLLVGGVTFVATYLGLLGAFAAEGTRILVLAGILSVLIPSAEGNVDDRLLGWAIAGLLGSLAMVLLWPEQPRPFVRNELATICRRLAAVLRSPDALDEQELADCLASTLALRERADSAISGPGGPRSRDQALMYIVDESGRIVIFLQELRVLTAARPPGAAVRDHAQLEATADLLEQTAAVLEGGEEDPDVAPLVELRSHDMETAREHLADDLAERRGSAVVLERFETLFPQRMVTYLCLSMATNAVVAMGRTPSLTSFEYQTASPSLHTGAGETFSRGLSALRANLGAHSRWFRNALRAAVALGAATAVAEAAALQYSFWVVLGTLSVLRSSAFDTGSTAMQSLLGTVGGFAVASGVILAVGDNQAALAVLFPIAVFAAGYLPGAVSFTAGQAAFTVMLVVLFNLGEAVGWGVGLVRVERVALGVGLSAAVAALMWPRGASAGLAAAVANNFTAALRYFSGAVSAALDPDAGSGPPLGRSHTHAVEAGFLAESEFGDYLNSRGSKPVATEVWARLVAQPHSLLLCADWFGRVAGEGVLHDASGVAGHTGPDLKRSLAVAARSVTAPIAEAVADLEPGDPGDGGASATTGAVHRGTNAELRSLRAAIAESLDDPDSAARELPSEVLALVWSLQWLGYVDGLSERVCTQLGEVREATERPWWR